MSGARRPDMGDALAASGFPTRQVGVSAAEHGAQAEEAGQVRVPGEHARDHSASLLHDLAGDFHQCVEEGFEFHILERHGKLKILLPLCLHKLCDLTVGLQGVVGQLDVGQREFVRIVLA